MTIAATRMYRFLSDFVSSATKMYDILTFLSSHVLIQVIVDNYSASDNGPKSNGSLQKLHFNKTPFNRIEVTVDTSYEEYQVPRMSPGHHTS